MMTQNKKKQVNLLTSAKGTWCGSRAGPRQRAASTEGGGAPCPWLCLPFALLLLALLVCAMITTHPSLPSPPIATSKSIYKGSFGCGHLKERQMSGLVFCENTASVCRALFVSPCPPPVCCGHCGMCTELLVLSPRCVA